MARYRTLIDNPWSNKGEIVENKIGWKWDGNGDQPIEACDYPSIWEPIEEEEPLDTWIVKECRWYQNHSGLEKEQKHKALAALIYAEKKIPRLELISFLTQRVKELENRKKV